MGAICLTSILTTTVVSSVPNDGFVSLSSRKVFTPRLCLDPPDVRRPNRPELKKAGNLRYTFSKTDGDYVFILDADFCPRADFLRETLPYFLDRTIGIVQTPQFFRYRSEQTWVERGAGVSQEFFYRLVQVGRSVQNVLTFTITRALAVR